MSCAVLIRAPSLILLCSPLLLKGVVDLAVSIQRTGPNHQYLKVFYWEYSLRERLEGPYVTGRILTIHAHFSLILSPVG